MTSKQITVRGILRSGKTLVLQEDTQLPDHLPDVPVTVRIELAMPPGVLRGGKMLIFEEAPQLPEPLPDLPVTVHIELPVGIGLLQAYGAWKDMPGVEDLDKELEELRYGKPRCKDGA
jgi:hypothetical protein